MNVCPIRLINIQIGVETAYIFFILTSKYRSASAQDVSWQEQTPSGVSLRHRRDADLELFRRSQLSFYIPLSNISTTIFSPSSQYYFSKMVYAYIVASSRRIRLVLTQFIFGFKKFN